jgi:hypothetical protein
LIGEKNGEEIRETENFGIVVAVRDPDGAVAFVDHATRAERQDAVDGFEWFDRLDAREARRRERRKGGVA